MRVDAVMTKTVVTIRSDALIVEAVDKLVERKISGLPVLNELGRLVGMVTEGDLLRRIELGTDHHPAKWLGLFHRRDTAARIYIHDHTKRVGDVMTRDPVSVDEGTPLDAVVALMERHRIQRVPVVADGGLVGIVSRSDLVRLLGRLMHRQTGGTHRPDAMIVADVTAALRRQAWFKPGDLAVEVHDGIVRFKGTVDDATIETAIRVAAETVLGVVSVHMAVERKL